MSGLLPKNSPASDGATDLGLIRTVYLDAIAFGSGGGEAVRGFPTLAALLLPATAVWGIWLELRGFQSIWNRQWYAQAGESLVFSGLFLVVGLLALLWAYSIELFAPDDDRVIFDRKHQKVYWISIKLAGTTRLKSLKRPVLQAASADWACIQAVHRSTFTASTAGASHQHELAFEVRENKNGTKVVDEFGIAPGMLLNESITPALYEHVRRYMQDGGPPLSPGNTAPTPTPPRPRFLWDSLALICPWSHLYFRWWARSPKATLAHHVLILLPVWGWYELRLGLTERTSILRSIPALDWLWALVPGFFLLWAMLNWLVYFTAQKATWPKEVLEALGPPLTVPEIQAGKGGLLVKAT